MALKEYKPGTTFPGRMGRTIGESDPAWPAPLRATTGGPNVLFIVLDDTGFGQLGAGPYDRWPLGRGFERYYGFLGGDTSQYYPDLVYDNHQVEPPKNPEEGII
jgi:arylsulfatase A-like enzyme